MRKYLLSCATMASFALLLSSPLAAQDKEKDKDNDKDNKKSKLNDNEQIIIKKKGDKDTKVTVEIKDGEVFINGKPLEEFDDDDVVIKKGKTGAYTLNMQGSPFRGQTGALNLREPWNAKEVAVPFLGVVTEEADKGAKVEEVTKGSAADKAGLKEGDVITKIDDASIKNQQDLSKAIQKHKPEEKVDLTYERNGKTEKITVTLGKRMNYNYDFEAHHFEMPNMNFDWQDNGNGARTFIAGGRPRLGIQAQDTEEGKGVKVLKVDDESAADKAGIKEDDIITEFDGKKVNSADELSMAARAAKEKNAVKITLDRKGKSQTVEVKTPKKLKTTNL